MEDGLFMGLWVCFLAINNVSGYFCGFRSAARKIYGVEKTNGNAIAEKFLVEQA